MSRTAAYTRRMRAKHIKRKKRIVSNWHWWGDNPTYYLHDGMYSKNKIHCSCPLCKSKAYYGKHTPTMQEKRNYVSEKEMWNEYADMVELADTPA